MDRYVIIEKIGEGAQGIVLKAHDKVAEKNVALKKLLLKNIENGISISIMREMKILQQLKHRNVCMFVLSFILLFNLCVFTLYKYT